MTLTITHACLIPITRSSISNVAIRSAESDGWKVYYLEDLKKEGPNIIRERLLDIALKDNVDYIRYLDDDDILLPHKDQIQFNDNDCIYMRHITFDIHRNTYELAENSGDPLKDAYNIPPWGWVATASALSKIRQRLGYVWNPNQVCCREGGWCWLNFLKSNIKIQYQPIEHYQFSQYEDSKRLSQNPYRIIYCNQLKSELKRYENSLYK